MSILIRTMTIDDLAAVELVQADAYSGYFLESAEVIAQRFLLSPTTAWVAEQDGRVCAYLVAYWSNIGKVNPLNAPFSEVDNPSCLYLHDLALLTSAQGVGVAKRLVHAAVAYAEQHTVLALALLSVQNSKEFWQRFGFAEYSDLDENQQANLNTYLEAKDSAFYMIKQL